jgi:hypothetical protein
MLRGCRIVQQDQVVSCIYIVTRQHCTESRAMCIHDVGAIVESLGMKV